MNHPHPIVSVVMCVQNAGQYLNQAIESILNQTYSNFEFIIINDGSSDNTQEIIESYNDKRITLIIQKENLGISKSTNIGIKKACGKYIARMDGDDFSYPERLAVQVAYMESHSDCVVLGTSYRLMDGNDVVTRKAYLCNSDDELRFMLLYNFPFCHPTLMLRSDIIKKHNVKYPEDMLVAEDIPFIMELSKHGKIACTKEYLFNYRTHDGGISKSKRSQLVSNALDIYPTHLANNLSSNTIPKNEFADYIRISAARTPLIEVSSINQYMRTMNELIAAYDTDYPNTDLLQIKKSCAEVLFKKIIIKDKNYKRPLNVIKFIANRDSLFIYFVLAIQQTIKKILK